MTNGIIDEGNAQSQPEVYLQLFKNSPLQGKDIVYLASAVQGFETTLFLLGLGRYPAALIICAGAIESAIKSFPKIKLNSSDDGLRKAVTQAVKEKPKLGQYELDKFICKRNDFVHRGYSPAHDGESVELLLTTGLPLLACCLWEFHKVSLRDNVVQPIWDYIEISQEVLTDMEQLAKRKSELGVNWQVGAAKALQYVIKHGFLPDFTRRWTHVDLGLPDHEYEARKSEMAGLENKWDPYVYVRCPIPSCQSSDCLVGLDNDLSGARLSPAKLFCFDCFFSLNEKDGALMQRLTSTELSRKRLSVLKDYGVAK